MIVELTLDEADPHHPAAKPRTGAEEEPEGLLAGVLRKVAAFFGGEANEGGGGGWRAAAAPSFQRHQKPARGKVNLTGAPTFSETEATSARDELRKLDRHLLAHIDDTAAWRRRAALSAGLKAVSSALVGAGTAAILDHDEGELLNTTMQFAETDPRFRSLLTPNLTSLKRGALLASIRNVHLDAEFHYLLHLAFAWRFRDADIFRQAIDAMRTGYAGSERTFHAFRDGQVISGTRPEGANRIGLMTPADEPRIRMNVNNFLLRMGCASIQPVALVRQQFRILLSAHLTPELANKLVSPIAVTPAPGSLVARKKADLDHWPHLPESERRTAATRRWFDTLTMEKIREISLDDMFTGALYRPTFLFTRADPEFAAELRSISWMTALPDTEFPPVSDGKPLAEAIYRRYLARASDWSAYFRLALGRGATLHHKARAQRLLLLMVTRFGPQKDFEPLIEPLVIDLGRQSPWDLYNLTLYCDIYRLSLAFRRKVDEQRLFNALLARLPEPPHGWSDFRDAAEHFILCLFLNGSQVRRFQLDRMLERTMRWLDQALQVVQDETMVDEILTLLSFLEVGTLADLVPENIEQHQFQERRRTLWMDHARRFATPNGFQDWLQQIDRSPHFKPI
ncbi:MAG: hypothetical protein OZSIB_0791 [Candidatus Ozemobacter sibiricus]|jgi:hypothetical protein|uniref:Uncharacterized protein n=1 Tax=Candidatus Ozemobacter sibiricus TaxID=2268124 RepID=A0A367ZUY4_9BACT|nr:MAG: hypothetical protein OZSIB_0791 [Candidatus Ozemobacter sibiricus]